MDTVVVATVMGAGFVLFAVGIAYAVVYVMNFMRDTEKRLKEIAENTQRLLDRREG